MSVVKTQTKPRIVVHESAWPKSSAETTVETTLRHTMIVAKTKAPCSLIVRKIKPCPHALEMASAEACAQNEGWRSAKSSAGPSSPLVATEKARIADEKTFAPSIICSDEMRYVRKR